VSTRVIFCEYCHLSWIEVKNGPDVMAAYFLSCIFLLSPFRVPNQITHVRGVCVYVVISCAFANVFVMLCAPSEFNVQDVYSISKCWISKCVCVVFLLNLTSELWIKSFLLLLDVFHTMHQGVYVVTCKSSIFMNGELMMVKEISMLL
jgi:hypothetical protein